MKKGPIVFVCVLLTGLMLFTGCYYDKASIVYPSGNCDTTNITLSEDITEILTANCFRCHSGDAAAGSGIQLDQYTVLKAYADNGVLLSAITHDGNVTFMPQDGGKLSDCEINKFKAWINSGAQDN
ncbi:hypothetical protein BH11BAC6_BH11BAC6_03310 [soil metagenome]